MCELRALYQLFRGKTLRLLQGICDSFQLVTLAISRWAKDAIPHITGVHSPQLQKRNQIPFCLYTRGDKRHRSPPSQSLFRSLIHSLSLRSNN